LLQNVRYALRQLSRSPGYATVALLTLAVGIGANAAIFSLVEASLLRRLPFHDPDRIVAIWEHNPRNDNPRNHVSSVNYTRWQERSTSFASMAAYTSWQATIAGAEDPIRVRMGVVTPRFFETLGVAPALGRGFVAEDSLPAAAPVAVLGDGLWRRRYGSDAAIVGRSIVVDGRPTTVVGVMPPQLEMPVGSALWLPSTIDEDFRERGGRFLGVVARLAPGVPVAKARAEMAIIAKNLERERPEKNTGWAVTVTPLHEDLVTEVRPQLLLLMAGVAVLLVMSCVNVSGLMLSRALTRAREFAIRSALGASRGRLFGQLLTESLVLAVMGGVAGMVLAHWALQALTAALPAQIPAYMQPRMNGAVLAFTASLCVTAALITGVAPVLRLDASPLLPALREGETASGVGPVRRRARGLLIAGQMALALVLVAGGGLLLRSYLRLSGVNPGFDARQVLTLDITLPDGTYKDPAQQARFFQEATDALQSLPGVTSAAGMSWLPFTVGSATGFEVVGRPAPPPGQDLAANVRFVTPGLFRTLGIPLREGRDFTKEDGPQRPTVVVVSEALARATWPGESALGKRVRMEWFTMLEAEVVGVVGDIRQKSLANPSGHTLYWHQAQVPTGFMSLVVKSGGVPPASLTPAAVAAVRGVDRGVAVEAKPLEEFVASTLDQQSFTLTLTLAFAVTAVLLAAVGLFGVVGQAVGERRREFALRIALGAGRHDIGRMVLGEGFRWTAVGAALGLPAALLAGHALSRFLFEVSPADPVTYAAVVVVLASSALLAVALPAWRAARVDPLVVLRAE
jgi:putative ABC transport system permease protein